MVLATVQERSQYADGTLGTFKAQGGKRVETQYEEANGELYEASTKGAKIGKNLQYLVGLPFAAAGATVANARNALVSHWDAFTSNYQTAGFDIVTDLGKATVAAGIAYGYTWAYAAAKGVSLNDLNPLSDSFGWQRGAQVAAGLVVAGSVLGAAALKADTFRTFANKVDDFFGRGFVNLTGALGHARVAGANEIGEDKRFNKVR